MSNNIGQRPTGSGGPSGIRSLIGAAASAVALASLLVGCGGSAAPLTRADDAVDNVAVAQQSEAAPPVDASPSPTAPEAALVVQAASPGRAAPAAQPPDKDHPGKGKGPKKTTTTASTTTTSTTQPTTTTTEATTTTTTTVPPPMGEPCLVENGGTADRVDFGAKALAGDPAEALNGTGPDNDTYLRTVYALPVPEEMAYVTGAAAGDPDGLRLRFDAADQPAEGDWTNPQKRSEMRTAVIDVPPVEGSTVAYCMYFDVDHPDLYGPATIFQTFSRELDRPSIGIELTGLNQFHDAVANEIQVVAVDGRHRISGALLDQNGPNALQVVVYYGPGNTGAYQVSLNGAVLRATNGVAMMSDEGIWWQFGLYLHGLGQDPATDDKHRRRDQLASGQTAFESTYRMVERVVYQPGQRSGGGDLSQFGTRRP